MLYITHRPKTLDKIFGQDDAIKKLKRITTTTDRSAILLTGPSGSGKTTIALALASELGISEEWGLRFVKSSEAGIDCFRTIEAELQMLPIAGRGRLVIIDEIHNITHPAQDYCLGLLERLPTQTHIVGTTTEQEPLGPILLSRWHRCNLDKPSPEHVHQALEQLAADAAIEPPPPLQAIRGAIERRQCNMRTCINDILVAGDRF